jgi:Ca-activated chloride channel family protein
MKKLVIFFSLIMLALIAMMNACSAAPTSYHAPTTTATTAPTYTFAPPGTTSLTKPATTTAPTTTRPATTYAPAPTITLAPAPSAGTGQPPITVTSIPAPTITIPSQGTTPPNTLGLATGGAKDINNFRENIRNNYLPLPTDITYEGLFYDYFFDMGTPPATDKLYAPSYSYAVTRDPLSGQTEYYLAVGLNSGMQESDFARKKLNLVIVVDDSGSMGEQYNRYYYDRYGIQQDAYEGEGTTRPTKMNTADNAVVSILDQLQSGDRFAIVLFNSTATLAKPMGPVSNTDMWSVKNNILNVNAGGNTNLSAGMQLATDQFRNLREVNSYDYENRIIILTDAQPNSGDFSAGGLVSLMQNNANSRIYTTFIGIGVDFNTDLTEQITKVKGANYYSVHSPREFRQRIDEEFDYMVTPLVFNLRMDFQSQSWRIDKVFGSPEADQATGQLMKINTLFPSKSEGGEVKGGIVLLKLRMMSFPPKDSIHLRVSYEDRNGQSDSSEQVIYLESTSPEYFSTNGIQKGVLLTRYAALLQNWTIDQRQHIQYSAPWNPTIREDTGIICPPMPNFSQWERQSMPLAVSDSYRKIFKNFAGYFEQEMREIQDNSLEQELYILNKLAG